MGGKASGLLSKSLASQASANALEAISIKGGKQDVSCKKASSSYSGNDSFLQREGVLFIQPSFVLSGKNEKSD
jgi:hypothetical protein